MISPSRSTTAANTAFSGEYQVIQRDLGVEALPLLFDISVAGKLSERADALLSAVDRNGDSETDTIRETARAIRDQGLPHLDELKTAYDRKRVGMQHTTYKRIQDYYLGFFRFLSYVSRSPLEWFTEGPDREVDALHAFLFADLLADIDWPEIVLVGLSVHHHNVEMTLAIARMVRTH